MFPPTKSNMTSLKMDQTKSDERIKMPPTIKSQLNKSVEYRHKDNNTIDIVM